MRLLNVPTVLKIKDYRFFFFSREELRMHIHVICPDGEAKLWLEPTIEIATSYKLSKVRLKEIEAMTNENVNTFKKAWETHFGN
jgi:hypothetical protein